MNGFPWELSLLGSRGVTLKGCLRTECRFQGMWCFGRSGPIVQASIHDLPKYCLVFTKVKAGGRLNVLVPGKVLDVGDVGAVVQQVGTKCMPQEMRSKLLVDTGPFPEQNEES